MVEADVAGEELEDRGQLEVRTPLQRGMLVAPAGVVLPVGRFELVLYVEEPDSRGSRDEKYGRLGQEIGAPAEDEAQRDDKQCQREVRAKHAVAHPAARAARHE